LLFEVSAGILFGSQLRCTLSTEMRHEHNSTVNWPTLATSKERLHSNWQRSRRTVRRGAGQKLSKPIVGTACGWRLWSFMGHIVNN
jgi:hypothetical protein